MSVLPALAGASAGQAALGQQSIDPGNQQQPTRQAQNCATSAMPIAIPRRESMIRHFADPEGQVRRASSIRKVGEVVGSHPEEAMAILRTWLHQPT